MVYTYIYVENLCHYFNQLHPPPKTITHHHHVTQATPAVIKQGANVAKDFVDKFGKSLGIFRGHISYMYDDVAEGTMYNVIYEDGDSEDLTEAECRAAVALYSQCCRS